MNRSETFHSFFSLLLSCQNTLSSPIPTPLLFVLQKWIVYLPLDSHILLLVFEEWVDTPIPFEMSVITYWQNSENLHTIEKWLFIWHTVNSCLTLVTPVSFDWKSTHICFFSFKYTRFWFCLFVYHTAINLSMSLSHIGCLHISLSHVRENTMKMYKHIVFGNRNITPSFCHDSCGWVLFFGDLSDPPLPSGAG